MSSTKVTHMRRSAKADTKRPVGDATRWSHVVCNLNALGPYTTGNSMHIFNDTGVAFKAMWDAVDEAKESVIWVTYNCKDDVVGQQTVQHLLDAADRGVKVHLLYDDGGNIGGRTKLVEPLEKHPNATVTLFNPFFTKMWHYLTKLKWNHSPGIRNHRKILVVDGQVGFAGGLNIGCEYAGTLVGGTGEFRDSMARIVGPSAKFLQQLAEDTIAAVEFSHKKHPPEKLDVKDAISRCMKYPKATHDFSEDIEDRNRGTIVQVLGCNVYTRTYCIQLAYQFAVKHAQHRVWLTTPYICPTRRLFKALLEAGRRGVDVRILMGSITTTSPWFMWWAGMYIANKFLKNKVRLYEYDKKTVHAKTIVIDGVWGAVASYNWDILSNKNLEVSLAAADYAVAETLEDHFLKDLQHAREITLDDMKKKRTRFVRFVGWLMYLWVRFVELCTFLSFKHKEVGCQLDVNVS